LPKHRVFISYSHRDRHAAVDLQDVLEEQRADTFLDQDRMDAADNLPRRIREGIRWCNCFLLLWSSRAASSSWVEQEWHLASRSGKKIIPYALDGTPLPPGLADLIYVESSDQEHGNAQLLTAVFGRGVRIDPTTLFPGRWQASMDASGMIQATYDLELRANGQVTGEGGASDSGLAGLIAGQMGMSGILGVRIPFQGTWSYDRKARFLTIETSTTNRVGTQQSDTIRIRTTGREKAAISGEDLAGRTWTLRRLGGGSSRPDDQTHREIRESLQQLYESTRGSPVMAVMLATLCVGSEEKHGSVVGLPTEEALRVLRPAEGQFQAAVQDFMRELQQGGWIS